MSSHDEHGNVVFSEMQSAKKRIEELTKANTMLVELNRATSVELLNTHSSFASMISGGDNRHAFVAQTEGRIVELVQRWFAISTSRSEMQDCPSPSPSPGKQVPLEEKYERLKAKYHRQTDRYAARERELQEQVDAHVARTKSNWEKISMLLPFTRSVLRVSPEGIVTGNEEEAIGVQGNFDAVLGPQLQSEDAAMKIASDVMPMIENDGSAVILVLGGKGSGRSVFFSTLVTALKHSMDDWCPGSRCTFDFAVSDADEYHVIARTVGEAGAMSELLLEKHKYGAPQASVTLSRADQAGSAIVVEIPVEHDADLSGILTLISCARERRRHPTGNAYESGNPLFKMLFPFLSTRMSFLTVVGVLNRDPRGEASMATLKAVAKMKQQGNRRVQD